MKSLLNKIESIPGTFSLKGKLSSSLISDVYECTYKQTKAVIRFDLPTASELAISNPANSGSGMFFDTTTSGLNPRIVILESDVVRVILGKLS